MYDQLYQNLPQTFEMLLLASGRVIGSGIPDGIISVAMPLKVQELVDKLEEISYTVDRKRRKRKMAPKQRSEEEPAGDYAGQSTSDGKKQHDRGRGSQISAEDQYGQWNQYCGDGADAADVDECIAYLAVMQDRERKLNRK